MISQKLLQALVLVVILEFGFTECKIEKGLVSDLDDELADEMALDGYSGGCTKEYDVKYSLLTLQWGPGICSTNECRYNPGQRFTIHGLWPQREGRQYLQFCCGGEEYNNYKLNDKVLSDMKKHWPSFHGNGDVFWRHEWLKHGTCAAKVGLRGMNEYFGYALYKFKQLDLLDALVNGGVRPDQRQIYEGRDVLDIISVAHGAEVTITCFTKDNLAILTEIHLCFDPKFKPINCPRPSHHCLGKIKVLKSSI